MLPDSVSVLADNAGTNGGGQGVLVGTSACSPTDGMARAEDTAKKETTTTTTTAVVQRGSIDYTVTTSRWPNQQDQARDDDPTPAPQSISVATKRKATAEESVSNVSHNQDDVLASPHCVGAFNSLNKRARLDSSSSNNSGDAAPADEQMFTCHVYAVQTDKSSQGIGSVHLSAQSTFADARLAILEKTASPLLPAHEPWNFHIPPTGRKIQKSLESSLGPLRSFLREKAPATVMKQGDVQLLCLSERVRLDIIRRSISSRNNGGEAMIQHTNEQWFTGRIHVIQADHQSVLEENDFILLSFQSTFADARRAIAEKMSTSPLLPAQQWQFHIPPLGNITDEEQESAFGPLRSYLQRNSPWTVSEKGDVELFLFVL